METDDVRREALEDLHDVYQAIAKADVEPFLYDVATAGIDK